MRIILLCGLAGAGKDTTADTLVEDYGYHKLSFAEPIRQMLRVGLGIEQGWFEWPLKEKPHPVYHVSTRRMMQTLGTEWGRGYIGKAVWTQNLCRLIDRRISETPMGGNYVISDMRFLSELGHLERYAAQVGAVIRIVAIERPAPKQTGFASWLQSLRCLSRTTTHKSERDYAKLRALADAILFNTGSIKQLQDSVHHMMEDAELWTNERPST